MTATKPPAHYWQLLSGGKGTRSCGHFHPTAKEAQECEGKLLTPTRRRPLVVVTWIELERREKP
jgi:hypothetical protein